MFIEESVVSRRSEVQGTEEFLDSRLDEARKRLEVTEERVQQFVRQNFGQLPEHLQAAVAKLENAQNQLATNSRMISDSLSRKSLLQTELAAVRKRQPALTGNPGSSGDPHENLYQLEAALVILKSKYSDRHPDVIGTRRRIENLKAKIAEQGSTEAGKKAPEVVTSAAALSLKREIGELDTRVAGYEKENAHLKAYIGKLRKDLEAMPVKEQELLKIKRDYENVKKNYEKLLTAREEAARHSVLVRSQKAGQFKVVEPAERPIIPAGPPRLLILGGGVGMSLFFFFIIPLSVYLLHNSYKSTDELRRDLGINIIGVIPPMVTPETMVFNKRLGSSSALMSIAALAVGVTIIFFAI